MSGSGSRRSRDAGTVLGRRLVTAKEIAESEMRAARDGFPVGPHALNRFRKWLGFACFRLARWLNPEVSEP